MITGTTDSGFEFQIAPEAMNDWRLLKVLRKIDQGETVMIVDAAERLLGEEQLERLEQTVERDGHVPVETLISEISDIMQKCNTLKNSSSSPTT